MPNYYILSLVYAAPGNASSNGYTNGTTLGTSTSVTSNFSVGTNLSVNVNANILIAQATLGSSFGFTGTSGNSQSFSDTYSSVSGSQIMSSTDKVDHNQDRFFIWLNPQVTVTQTGTSTGSYTLNTPAGQPFDILDVSVAELRNPALIPPGKWNQQNIHGQLLPGLSVLSQADRNTILATDPLASINPATAPSSVDPNRFVYIDARPLEGPAYPGAGRVSNSFIETDAQTTTTVNSESESYQVGFAGGYGVVVSVPFSLNVQNSVSFTWTNSTSIGASSGTTHQASVTLGSQTPKCMEWVDIYEDTLFHTFAFVQPTGTNCGAAAAAAQPIPPAALSGKVSTFTGDPLAHQLVKITLSDGTVRNVYTNSKGNYMLYSAPDGPVILEVGKTLMMESTASGRTTVANIMVP